MYPIEVMADRIEEPLVCCPKMRIEAFGDSQKVRVVRLAERELPRELNSPDLICCSIAISNWELIEKLEDCFRAA